MTTGVANPHPIGVSGVWADMTSEQKYVHGVIELGPRGSVPSPFLAMFDAPALANALQKVGVVLRFEGGLDLHFRQ